MTRKPATLHRLEWSPASRPKPPALPFVSGVSAAWRGIGPSRPPYPPAGRPRRGPTRHRALRHLGHHSPPAQTIGRWVHVELRRSDNLSGAGDIKDDPENREDHA
jgi:hypothetical protein